MKTKNLHLLFILIIFSKIIFGQPGVAFNPDPLDNALNIAPYYIVSWKFPAAVGSITFRYSLDGGVNWTSDYMQTPPKVNWTYLMDEPKSNKIIKWQVINVEDPNNFINGPIWTYTTRVAKLTYSHTHVNEDGFVHLTIWATADQLHVFPAELNIVIDYPSAAGDAFIPNQAGIAQLFKKRLSCGNVSGTTTPKYIISAQNIGPGQLLLNIKTHPDNPLLQGNDKYYNVMFPSEPLQLIGIKLKVNVPGTPFNIQIREDLMPAYPKKYYEIDEKGFVDFDNEIIDNGGPNGVTPGIPTTAKTWTGATGNLNWFDGANWNPLGVPITEDVLIPATKSPMVEISGGFASTGALTVNFGAGIIIKPFCGLTTNGLITNNGLIVIESDAENGYAGTFIDNGGLAGIGTFEFDRIVLCSGTTYGSTDPLGWHYLAAPFDGFTSDGIFDYYSNKWDRTGGLSGTGAWIQMTMPSPPNPDCTPWPPEFLNVMDAWSVNFATDYLCAALYPGTGNQVEFISGVPGVHTGNYGKALGYGPAGYQMWNMVSNPYPSGLDVSLIGWGPNTVQAAYYYDGCAGNYVYWAAGMGSYVMAPTLGFMVETTGPDVLNVSNADRAHNPDWFWKADVANLLTLQATGTGGNDILHVRFANDVTANFDKNGDAHKLFATTANLPQIYTLAGSEKLAINALPETQLVPMGVVGNGAGEYTIEAIETSDFQTVLLEDKATGIITDLLTDTYSFYYKDGDDENRFVIHFGDISTENETGGFVIYSSQGNIVVYNINNQQGDVYIYNVMGQQLGSVSLQDGINNITLDNAQGYYIVNVRTSENVVNKKVYIH